MVTLNPWIGKGIEMTPAFDVEINELINDEEIKSFTTYLNTNVHEGKIIFEEEVKRAGLVFLDTKVRMKEGYLVFQTYRFTQIP